MTDDFAAKYPANDAAWKMVMDAALSAFAANCTRNTDAGKASEHVKAALKGPVLEAFLDATPDDADALLDMARAAGRAAAKLTK